MSMLRSTLALRTIMPILGNDVQGRSSFSAFADHLQYRGSNEGQFQEDLESWESHRRSPHLQDWLWLIETGSITLHRM